MIIWIFFHFPCTVLLFSTLPPTLPRAGMGRVVFWVWILFYPLPFRRCMLVSAVSCSACMSTLVEACILQTRLSAKHAGVVSPLLVHCLPFAG